MLAAFYIFRKIEYKFIGTVIEELPNQNLEPPVIEAHPLKAANLQPI